MTTALTTSPPQVLPLAMRDQLIRLVGYAKSQRWLNDALRYHPVLYPLAMRAITRLDVADPAARLARQQDLLRETLKLARRTRYGRTMPTDIRDWPVLTKERVRQDPDAFHAPSLWPIPAATSGSSGVPLRLERSLSSVAAEQAFFDHILAPSGLNFRTARVAVLRGDYVKPPSDMTAPFWKYRDAGYLVMSFPHLNPRTFGWFADELEKFRPDILWVYPTGGMFLANLFEAQQRALKIPVVLSSSEMLWPSMREQLQRAFGGLVVDYYGQAERVCLSTQSSAAEAFFQPAYGAVELRPLPPTDSGTREAKVVATGFWNRRMPLIRYDTGDRVAYPAHYADADLQLVALGLKPFLHVLGRQTEYLVTPDGGQILGLNNIPREVSHILQVQFIQHERDRVEIRVRADHSFSSADRDKLMANARTKIPDTVQVTIVTDRELETTAQHKTPFVIRRVD